MNRVGYLLILALLMPLVPSCNTGDSVLEEPWKEIFNGVDLGGWSIVGSEGKFWVEDSAIMCHQVSNTPEHTFLSTNKEYDNFILECKVKIDEGYSSGILFRCVEAPDTASTSLFGYQTKIDPSPRKWTGGIMVHYGYMFQWYYTLKDDSIAREAFRINEWNRFRIEAIDTSIKIWINDIPTCNLINSDYIKGTIALKIHSLGNDPEKEAVKGYFKNIRMITKEPEKYAHEMDIAPLRVD